jgi:hypothetical protein
LLRVKVASGPIFARDGKSCLYAVASRGEVTIYRQPWRDGRIIGASQVALNGFLGHLGAVIAAHAIDSTASRMSRELSSNIYSDRDGRLASTALLANCPGKCRTRIGEVLRRTAAQVWHATVPSGDDEWIEHRIARSVRAAVARGGIVKRTHPGIDRRIEKIAKQTYPETALLKQVKGVRDGSGRVAADLGVAGADR